MASTLEELGQAVALYKGLVEVSALINSINDFNQLLSAILDVAARVMRAEGSSLFLVDPDSGEMQLTIARGPAGDFLADPVKIPQGCGIASWVRENRQSLLVTDAYQDGRFYADLDRSTGFVTRSVMCVPLLRQDQEIGVLEVLNPREKAHFEPVDLAAFEAYGTMVSTAIAKMKTLEREREQRRFAEDLALAQEIQTSFLPDTLPEDGPIHWAAHYRPAKEIAGDFYDVLYAGDGTYYLVVGDVCGKGISAALVMAQAISMLRLIVSPLTEPGALLERWNRRLSGKTIRGMFITAVLGRLHPAGGRLEYAIAGHTAPIFREAGGRLRPLPNDGGAPLGVIAEERYPTNCTRMRPGDQAIFYTDGLLESFNAARENLSMEKLTGILAENLHDPNETIRALINAEAKHRGKTPPHDDLTLLSLSLR